MKTDKLFQRLDDLLDRLEVIMPAEKTADQDWSFHAYRWRKSQLQGVADYHLVDASELLYIERQAEILSKNTRQFMLGQFTIVWSLMFPYLQFIFQSELQCSRDLVRPSISTQKQNKTSSSREVNH